MVDVSKLQFFSGHPIDKIVDSGEITIENDGDTTGSDEYYRSKIVTDSTPHTYDRAGLVRARWSIDGGSNWQALESLIVYTYTLTTGGGTTTKRNLDSGISVGSDTSNVYFRTANGKHGNVSVDGSFNATYTPQSRTFIIQWWMYERE